MPHSSREGRHERYEALARMMKRHGLSTHQFVDPCAEQYYGYAPAIAFSALVENVDRAFNTLVNSKDTTAIITTEEHVAARLLQQAPLHGLRIPRDLSVLCMTHFEMASLLSPPLTTLDQHPDEMGRQAVAVALARLGAQSDNACIFPEVRLIPVQLMKRASCGPARPA